MKKQLFKKVLFVLVLLLTVAFISNYKTTKANADENVLFSEDFEGQLPDDYSNYFTVENGVGTIKGDMHTFTFPTVQSNNYVLEFDMKLNFTSTLYVHFVGLNGTTGENIYFKEEAFGTYWSINDYTGHSVYNNSGDNHGGLDYRAVDLNEFVRVKFVHYEGYLELWLNGTRRAVTHLSNFGNNNYSTRTAIEEGIITSIMFHAEQSEAVVLDNLTIKEAKAGDVSYEATNAETSAGAAIILPLSAQNLASENFKVTTTFKAIDKTAANYYPTVQLFGLNASLTTQNQREYSVNVQGYVDQTNINPQVYAQIEGDNPWSGVNAEQTYSFADKDEFTYTIEVYGDKIDVYLDGELAVSTSFTAIGITKGHLQYIRVRSGGGGAGWTKVTYQGYEKTTGASITADKTRIKLGDTVNLKAELFGEKLEGFKWYIDGAATSETALTYSLDTLTAGIHTITYQNDTIQSNEITVEVIENLIVIETDKKTAYKTDTITITATLEGDFSESNLKWYVNGTEQEETTTTLTLTNMAVGTYEIKYADENSTSNVVTVTVINGTLTLVTEKNSYFVTEIATITAEKLGISEEANIKWFINGVETETTGAELTIDASKYQGGDQVLISAVSEDITSNELIITFVYDVLASLKEDPNFKVVNEIEIVEGKEYGNLTVGSDEEGAYLYSQVTEGQNYWTIDGNMPTSVKYMMEYKLYVPADYSQTAYVYPCGLGLNALAPDAWIEIALNVNAKGIEPYVKDQSTGKTYNLGEYGFNKDLNYGAGITVKGGYNTIAFVADGSNLSFYINGELVLFYVLKSATLPKTFTFNMYPDGGTGNIPLRVKDYKFYGIVEEAPSLQSVSISASKIEAKVNEEIVFAATINPFNATYETISWYVNGTKTTATELNYTFKSNEAGTYEIYCEIDGIKSATKTITIVKDEAPTETTGCSCNKAILLFSTLSLITIAASSIVLRKKH